MNYYKYYKNLRLDELDIASDEEAEELEFELELRFEEFTPRDRKTWLQQNAYLEHFSRIGSVTSAAREAGVTVYKAQTWKFDNVLGFTRRLEVADLAFNDRLKEKAFAALATRKPLRRCSSSCFAPTSRSNSPETATSATPRSPTNCSATSARTPAAKWRPATPPSAKSPKALRTHIPTMTYLRSQ